MEKKTDNLFGGFSAIANDLSGRNELDATPMFNQGNGMDEDPTRTIMLGEEDDEDTLAIQEFKNSVNSKLNDTEDDDDSDDDIDDNDDIEDDEEDAEEDEAPTKTKKNKKAKVETDDEDEDSDEDDSLGEVEADVAEYVQEQLFNKLNLDLDEGEDKFKSMDDVVAFIEESIEANSLPEYSSEDVANIDNFVRNGGDLTTYMKSVYGSNSLDNIDIDNEDIQKSIIKEDLLNQGMSEARAKRRIDRMEDGGILAEEAEDSLESLKEFRTKQEQTLLANQQKAAEDTKNKNLEFVSSVESELNAMQEILGNKISKAEKDKLFNYMLKPTSTGIPQYHIDYANNRKNMIESAYFTMMGDKLLKKVETKAKSKAVKSIKNKLADKGSRGKNQATAHSSSLASFSSIVKAFS